MGKAYRTIQPSRYTGKVTREEVAAAVRSVSEREKGNGSTGVKAAASGATEKRIYVERRGEGDYAVRRAGSQRASDVKPTQKEAIERARELEPGVSPRVERVRHTGAGTSDKWRKA